MRRESRAPAEVSSRKEASCNDSETMIVLYAIIAKLFGSKNLSVPRHLVYGDKRLRWELWVDANRQLIYTEGCGCVVCVEHRCLARALGRCSEHCGVCFDGMAGYLDLVEDHK